jgi:hypothetical protein
MRYGLMALLALTTTVYAQEPQGTRGEQHSEFHSFYEGLFNNKKNVSCCHDHDCRPTQSRMINDHYEVMINGNWIRVEDKAIIPKMAPDGGAHICAGDPTSLDPAGRIYCVILPPET